MNTKTLLLLVLSMALVAMMIGCGAQEDTATVDDVADKTTEMAGDAAEGAADVVAEGFDAVKAEFCGGMKTTVDEWNVKIADCETKLAAMPEIAQKPLAEPVKTLKAKGAALAASVTGLEGATEETFDAEKTKVEASLGEVKGAYDKVMGLF